MARVRWSGDVPNKMAASVTNVPNDFLRVAADIINDITASGASDMREFISTRGTGWNGHQGRIDTGHMLESVNSDSAQTEGRSVKGSYGWTQAAEDYFYYQEAGFNHVNGKKVPAMHALLDSFNKAREEFVSRIDQAVK